MSDHPPTLPHPSSEPHQNGLLSGIEGIFSRLAVTWAHLPTHTRLMMNHLGPPGGGQPPLWFPSRALSPQMTSYQLHALPIQSRDNTTSTTARSHSIPDYTGERQPYWDFPCGSPNFRYTRTRLRVLTAAIRQLPSALSMALSSSPWVATVVCDFPCGDMNKHIFITERVLMTDRRKDSA